MGRTRAERRGYAERAKARARRLLASWARAERSDGAWITPRLVGHFAATHNCPCSCLCCRNPRPQRPRAKDWRRWAPVWWRRGDPVPLGARRGL